MTTKFQRQLIQFFECPVCLNYLYPPIHQCVAGHVICQKCFERVDLCPQCRGPKALACAFILEKMHSLLQFPCKYASAGCDFIAKGMAIFSHETFCDFAPWTCPLRFDNGCLWENRKELAVKHLKECHSGVVFYRSEEKLVCKGLLTQAHFHPSLMRVFYVYDTLFRAFWEIEEETGLINFAVSLLVKGENDDRFSYELCILQEDSDVEAINLRAPCLYLSDTSLKFEGNNILLVHCNMIKRYCNSNGDLNYVIRIYDNDDMSKTEKSF